MTEDWRLSGQDRYLKGARFRRTKYRAPSATWDHDHCEFCNEKFAERGLPEALHEGWQSEDEYRWVCDACFEDFRGPFAFDVIGESATRRGVEFHDARIEDIQHQSDDLIVRLKAFVHDDATSDACAGEWNHVQLQLRETTVETSDQGDRWVLDGSVQVDAERFDNILPIPFRRDGSVTLVLSGARFSVVVHAQRAWLVVVGPPGDREAGTTSP